MKLWFCETCGKRISEDDLAKNMARDKQAKGVYCAACAVGVHTTSFDAIQTPQPPAVVATAPVVEVAPAVGAPVKLSRPRPPSDTLRLRTAPSRDKAPASKTLPYMILGAGGLILLGGIFLVMKSGSAPMPPDTSASAKQEAVAPRIATATPPVPSSAETPKTKTPQPATPSTPVIEKEPDNKAQALSSEQKAEAAFERLQKALAALPEQDKAGRIALAEAFVKDYGDEIVGGRARAMISKWRETAVAPAPAPTADQPPAEAPAVALHGFTSLLGKDLSNWIVGSESKDYSMVDGALVLGPGFRGRFDTPIKLKNFVLEIEYFFENASGSGMEFGTPAGYMEVNRTSAGRWDTVQFTVQDGKLSAKFTVGSGDLKPVNTDEPLAGAVRIYAIAGTKKTIRAIRIAEIKP